MSHLTVPQRERLRFILAAIDDGIEDAETQPVRVVLWQCRRAVENLIAIPRPARRGVGSDLGKA